ncbi:MAG: alpha/beta hydrolase [Dehalococcoidia bacterium]|nr:alpha/beta hydrolase [Dehalococcoidia bacterium]
MPFAQVNDARMFYTDEGEGSPVLMVHGWSCDGSDWAWQIPALKAAGYRCITPDLRGHGRSSVPAGGYTPRQYAADLAGLIGQLRCGPRRHRAFHGRSHCRRPRRRTPGGRRAVVPVDSAYGFESETAVTLPQMTQAFRGPGRHDVALQFASAAFYGPATPAHLPPLHARRIAAFDQEVMAAALEGLILPPDQFGEKPRSETYLRRVAARPSRFALAGTTPQAWPPGSAPQFQHRSRRQSAGKAPATGFTRSAQANSTACSSPGSLPSIDPPAGPLPVV